MKPHLPVALLVKLLVALTAVVGLGVYENEHPNESVLDGNFFSDGSVATYRYGTSAAVAAPAAGSYATGNRYAEAPGVSYGSGFRAVAADPGDKLVYTAMPTEASGTTIFATGNSLRELEASSRYSDTGKGCYFSESYNYYRPYKGAEELYQQNGNWDFMGSNLAPSINHGSSSVSGALGGLTHDVSMCWANATANVLQYWQSYYGIFYDGSHGALPYGWNYDPSLAQTLGGSQSLAIYNEFYKHWKDEGGTFKWASDWYCRGVDPSKSYIKDEGLGGWWEMAFGESKAYVISYFNGSSRLESLTRVFAASLGYTQQEDKSWAQTTAGQIGYLGISSYLGGHALTCWGMDFNDDGLLKSIYIANSDDLQYGTERIFLKSVDGQYYMFSDEECTEYWNWNAANWYLDEVSYLNTPQSLKDLYLAYSSSDLTWTGAADEWSERFSADKQIGYALPDKSSGWVADVKGTAYHSYYEAGRNLVFGDAATTHISTSGALKAGRVELANEAKEYIFTATEAQTTLDAAALHAVTSGSARFIGMEMRFADSLLLDGYALSVQHGSLSAGTGTLQGGASLTLQDAVASFTDLLLGEGTVLTLDFSRAGDEQALISVSGTLTIEGALTLNVGGLPTDLSEIYMVMNAGTFDTASWGDNITLNGTTAEMLFWRDNVLYYGSYVDKKHQYFTEHTEAPEKWRKFEALSFSGIEYAEDGAAFTNLGSLSLEKNGPVEFIGNSAQGSGGAVANAGTLNMEGNKSVLFRSNSAANEGGALANTGGSVSISGSQAVSFENNRARTGGALYLNGGSTSISGNESVSFANNSAADAGGAVSLSGGTLQLTDNGALSFSGNSTNGSGGAIRNAGGQLIIRGNGDTLFTDNHAGVAGGAISNTDEGRVTLYADKGDITFRGNTQGSGANTILRAINSQGDLHTDDMVNHFSAAEGHRITFYDSVRVENTAWYGQTNFNTQGSGTIVFSGRYAEQDLRNATGSAPSAAALAASRTSEFTGSIYLAGGTLRLEDGASLTADSLYFADGAAAVTVELSDGSLLTPNSYIDFNTNKTLELTGANTVSASYFAFEDGGTLTFNLSEVNRDSAMLSVISPDLFDMQGSLTLNFNGTEELEGGMYKLIETQSGYRVNASLTLNGAAYEALKWDENGILWFDADYRPYTPPPTDLVFTETQRGDLDYCGNDSLTFTPVSGRAIDETGAEPASVRLAENGDVYFHDISITGDGGIIGNVSHGAAAPSTIVIEDNEILELTRSKASGDGGAIDNRSLGGGTATLLIRGNNTDPNMGAASLSANSAGGAGGMLYNSGTATFTQNGEISIGSNHAEKHGGALYNAAGAFLSFTRNDGVNLGQNGAEGRGGAIANYGEMQLNDNNFVTAAGNSSLYGAAVYNEGSLEMVNNGYIQFAGNDCTHDEGGYRYYGIGGNICNAGEGMVSIRDNGNVSLSSAYAMHGGSIYNEGSMSITANRDVNIDSSGVEGNGGGVLNHGTFVLSNNRNVTFNEDWAWGGYGGAICNMQGRAELEGNESLSVYSSYTAFSNGTTAGDGHAEMSISYNGDILFYDNIAYRTEKEYDGKAGAILNLADGTLNILGNDRVEFRNNTILTFAEISPTGKDFSYLHALHNEGTLNLAAKAGQSIIFYDGISATKDSTVVFNNVLFSDTDGKTQSSAGEIIFSGALAESILRSNMTAEYVTEENIRLSQTSDIETSVYLGAGRLRVEGGAVLNTGGLTVNDTARVLVNGATLTSSGDFILISGASAELSDGGKLSAQDLWMQAGATLSVGVNGSTMTLSSADGEHEMHGRKLTISESRISGQGGTLVNTLIDLKAGVAVELSDVVLAAGSRVTDDPATLLLDNVRVQGVMGVNAQLGASDVLSNPVFVQSGNEALTFAAGENLTVTQVVLSTFDNVALSGDKLAITLSGFGGGTSDLIALSFTNGGDFATFDRSLSVSLTLTNTGQIMQGWFRQEDVSPTTVYFGDMLTPEPATATLSLLALAALAARRRRS